MLTLAAAAATFSCLHAPVRRSQQEPPWLALESPHFSLRAQLPEVEAREQLVQLEGLYAVLTAKPAWAALKNGLAPLRVVVVADTGAMQELVGERLDALSTTDLFGDSLLIAAAVHVDSVNRPLLHAVAHILDDAAFPSLPTWLAEGLATRAESLRLRDGEAILDSNDAQAVALLRSNRREDGTILLHPRGETTFQREAFDVWAWLLVESLWASEPESLSRFLEQLAQGKPEDAAWTFAFPQTSFEKRVRAVLGEAPPDAISPAPVSAPTGPARALYVSEVHSLQAELFALAGRKDEARREATLALQTAPGDPASLELLGAPALLAVEDRPRDARAWLVWAESAKGELRQAALRAAATLAPLSPGPLLRLAAESIDARDRSATAYAAAAVERGRTAPALDLLGIALCAAGDGDGAKAAWAGALLRADHAKADERAVLLAHDVRTCTVSLDRVAEKSITASAPLAPRTCAMTPPTGGGHAVVFAQYSVASDGRPQELAVLDQSKRGDEVRAFLESCRFDPLAAGERVTAPFVFAGEP